MDATTVHKIPGFPFTVTGQDVADILVSCFEGGSNAWVRSITPVGGYPEGASYGSDVPTFGGALLVRYDDPEREEGNGKGRMTLRLDDVLRGIGALLRFQEGTRFHMGYVTGPEADAGSADCILQFAILGDIVYG